MSGVLVIAFSNLANDPRVSRQVDWLAGAHDVVAAGSGPIARPNVRFVPIGLSLGGQASKALRGLKLLARRHESVYWSTYGAAYAQLAKETPDLIVANDLDTLPLAVRLSERCRAPVLYDAHEYAPREFDDSWRWRLLRAPYALALTKKYVPRVAALTTVGHLIAEEFDKLTGVRAEIITNAPVYHPDLKPRPVAGDGIIRIVHHGAAIPGRRIENMVRLGPLLEPRFELNFMLVENDRAYVQHLRQLAADSPRIRFLPPVPMPDLPARLNQFDLGIFLLEPNSFNNRFALPNKLFEFLQARLGVIIGPSPEMARVVQSTGAGIVTADFRTETMADAINALKVADVARFKEAAHTAAHAQSAEANRARFLAIVQRLLAK